MNKLNFRDGCSRLNRTCTTCNFTGIESRWARGGWRERTCHPPTPDIIIIMILNIFRLWEEDNLHKLEEERKRCESVEKLGKRTTKTWKRGRRNPIDGNTKKEERRSETATLRELKSRTSLIKPNLKKMNISPNKTLNRNFSYVFWTIKEDFILYFISDMCPSSHVITWRIQVNQAARIRSVDNRME